MANKKETNTPLQLALISDLEAQRSFIQKKKQQGNFDFSIVVADAFVRGIRDIGYKNTGTALDELIDNSIQAGAASIHIFLGFVNSSNKQPSHIAVVDDGHGMDPDMIRVAMMWGGTHRENDRTGFGRYGYGLPSASISQGRHFEVYSQPEDGNLYMCNLDVNEINTSKYRNKTGQITIPAPQKSELPSWLSGHIKNGFKSWKRGTAVVISNLDRLTWKTADTLTDRLAEHFGVVYRNYLRQVNIYIEGRLVEPLDPLFITPGYRYYDLDEDRAEALEPMIIKVKGEDRTNKVEQTIKVRFSSIPPSFGRIPEHKTREDARGTKHNKRFPILREYNTGIIVLRNGRQIDVVTKCPWTTFQNNDRYWGVELDFDAGLDEEFSITTSKQQVTISSRIWEILQQNGVERAIESLRSRFVEANAKLRSDSEQRKLRASEEAMKESAKYRTKNLVEPTTEEKLQGEQKLIQEIERFARESSLPIAAVEAKIRSELLEKPYAVRTESMPGAPFYRVDQVGGQQVVYMNTAHRFYMLVYAGPGSTPYLRASLEVLLLVLGVCELDARADRRRFYEAERAEWSKQLATTLDTLQLFLREDEERPELAGTVAAS